MSKPVNDIWKDPEVQTALKSNRSADDIQVIACPDCCRWGYYNEGSWFSCRFCDKTWLCLSEGEQRPAKGIPYLRLDECEPISLADTVTVTTEGYHNETLANPRDGKS